MSYAINRITNQYIKRAHTPSLNPAVWLINPDLSAVRNIPAKYWKVSGNSVVEMNNTEKAIIDTANLNIVKSKAKARINGKTQQLLSQGFSHSGHIIPLDIVSSIKYIGILAAGARAQYPITITVDNDSAEFIITGASAFGAMYTAGMNRVQQIYNEGRTLLMQIEQATTIDEIYNIIDNRS